MEQLCAQPGWYSVVATNEIHLWTDTSEVEEALRLCCCNRDSGNTVMSEAI